MTLIYAIPIPTILIGALNVGNCPVQQFIPIWMIILGITIIIKWAVNFCSRVRYLWNKRPPVPYPTALENIQLKVFSAVTSFFLFAWIIAGKRIYRKTSNYTFDPVVSFAGKVMC